MPEPVYVFDDDGTAYAYLNGKIVASAADADELEAKLAYGEDHMQSTPQADPNGQPAPFPPDPSQQDPSQLGGDSSEDPSVELAVQILEQHAPELLADDGSQDPGQGEESAIGQADLPSASPDTLPGDNMPPRATHVETPNGLKGQILGRVKGLWGDQVTIRLENGRIAKFDVSNDLKFTDEKTQKTASSSPVLAAVEALETRLEQIPDGTRSSLINRVAELKRIKAEAQALVRNRQVTAGTVEELIITADHELREVNDVLSALEDAVPYAPPEPVVLEQESVGGNDSSWLDDTLGEMIAEAESTDFDQMMDEEPSQIVAEMETPALQDAEGVQAYAASVVASKTAGIEHSAVNEFREVFLAQVEKARQVELTTREKKITQEREASTENYDGPAEGLFL